MGLSKVWIFPLATFLCSLAGFVLSYVLAVYYGHVTAFWPYISDSGTTPPESCIFGQLLNLAALFLAITVYLRHRQIVEFYWHHHKQIGNWRAISCTLLWFGYLSAFGVSMAANFQENNVLHVHYTGALLAFGCGLVYCCAQTVFSYRMNPKMAKPIVSHFRLLLCVVSAVCFVTMIVFGPILGKEPENYEGKDEDKLYHWEPTSPNYREHMIGTCSEWMLAICFQLYILSFAIELRSAYVHAPKLKLNASYDDYIDDMKKVKSNTDCIQSKQLSTATTSTFVVSSSLANHFTIKTNKCCTDAGNNLHNSQANSSFRSNN